MNFLDYIFKSKEQREKEALEALHRTHEYAFAR